MGLASGAAAGTAVVDYWKDSDFPCIFLVGMHDHSNPSLRALNWKVGRLGLTKGANRKDEKTTDTCLRVVFDGQGGCEHVRAAPGGPSGAREDDIVQVHVPLRHMLFVGARQASSGPHERLQSLLKWRKWREQMSPAEQHSYRPERMGYFPPEAMDYVADMEECYRRFQTEYTKDGRPDFDSFFQHVEMVHGLRMATKRLEAVLEPGDERRAQLQRGDLDTSDLMLSVVEQYWNEFLDPIVALSHRKAFAKTLLVDSLFNFDDPANCHVDAMMQTIVEQMQQVKLAPTRTAP